MSAPSDPILRALQAGDEACPDGRALARLGELSREAATPPRPVDLVARITAACADLPADAVDDDADLDERIDAVYDGDAEDSELRRLGGMIREAATPEGDIDLLPSLEGRFSDRHSSRRQATRMDAHTRWRIWTAVIGGHVAALVALAVFNVSMGQLQPSGDDGEADEFAGNNLYVLPTDQYSGERKGSDGDQPLPETWAALQGRPEDLVSLRLDEKSRAYARTYYNMQGSVGVSTAGVQWLVSQRQGDGSIGGLSGNLDSDLAVQALAALALSGQGKGATTADAERLDALAGVLDLLSDHVGTLDQVREDSRGLVLWALVDGSLLLQEDRYRRAAERALGIIDTERLVRPPGPRQADGIYLGVAIAQIAGYDVPEGLGAACDAFLRDVQADQTKGVYLLQVREGVRRHRGQAASVAGRLPQRGEDGRIDPLRWFGESMVVRELGGRYWWDWSEALQAAIIPTFSYLDEQTAFVPASAVRFGEVAGASGDVFATSLALVNLQVPYRYLPLRY